MNQHEENRAWEVFQAELRSTRDPRGALHAALVDLESRQLPVERQRVAQAPVPRPLLDRYRTLVEAVCASFGVTTEMVCSFDRAVGCTVDARGVLVAILTDAGLSARKISDGIGMSNSVVNNLRLLRPGRPAWEPLIAQHAPMLGERPR